MPQGIEQCGVTLALKFIKLMGTKEAEDNMQPEGGLQMSVVVFLFVCFSFTYNEKENL